jgi:hypothetical protein
MALAACGGGSSNPQDSGIEKTYLKVQASDAQGDALSYQWRVTGGTIDNPNGPETVWTLPSTPGLHFAYVLVSDGKGGYVQQQYAASSDAFGGTLAPKPATVHTPPPADDIAGTSGRLRLVASDNTAFAPPGGGAKARRLVVLPDIKVELLSGTTVVAGGLTDLGGELSLPRLPTGQTYTVRCAADDAAAVPANCGTYTVTDVARRLNFFPALTASRNLRLFGHVGLADGGVCAADDEYFGLRRSATVRLLAADGSVVAGPRRVNRFGDYLLDAAVPVSASLRLEVQCEGLTQSAAVPTDPAGYAADRPIEVSVVLANSRPQIQKVVANGPDGNVRGRMVTPLADAESNALPGGLQFLAYKGADTAASACRYYRSFGATRDCDAQGRMIDPISFDDWKKARGFGADGSGSAKALYINQMDLNLVRRMVAVEQAANDIAFYVCNTPGPDTQTQAETNERIDTALRGERLVACVAMEWSPTPGVNGGQPFTKFLTFGPDGSLLPSVNLDGRGEKFLPGTCVACHGGSLQNGSFPDRGNPSPNLGSRFLPFDTGNYLFGSGPGLTESDQGAGLHALNQLVRKTEADPASPTSLLIDGWYAAGGTTLDKSYVPPSWRAADSQPATAGAALLYREVVGGACRTCHVAMGPAFNWDEASRLLGNTRVQSHVCGGSEDLAVNASMPNALVSRDRIAERIRTDPALAEVMTRLLGCSAPKPDPVYPKR